MAALGNTEEAQRKLYALNDTTDDRKLGYVLARGTWLLEKDLAPPSPLANATNGSASRPASGLAMYSTCRPGPA
jgi:hypothetical protein